MSPNEAARAESVRRRDQIGANSPFHLHPTPPQPLRMNTTPNLIFLETLRLSLDCFKPGIDRATANSSPNTSHQPQLPRTSQNTPLSVGFGCQADVWYHIGSAGRAFH